MTVIACPTGGSFIRGKDSRTDADVDSTNKALHVKVTEQPVNSYETDSIKCVGNVREIDLGTFTMAGIGDTVDLYPCYLRLTWMVISDSSATAHEVRLEGSLDGSNWDTLDTSNTTGNDLRSAIWTPVRYIRANVVNFGDATQIKVLALAKDG